MKRLTYQTVGDAMHPQHHCHGPGIRKDDLLQRHGKLEDAIEKMTGIIRNEKQYVTALRLVGDVIADLDREKGARYEMRTLLQCTLQLRLSECCD